jgi:hypothetical protein
MHVYDDIAPRARANGWDALPIGPGTKWPQVVGPDGKYTNMMQWQQPGRSPAPHPQPTAGWGVRLGQYGNVWIVALDFDNQAVAERAMTQGVLTSAICKVGKSGFTSIYKSDKPIESRDIRCGGRNVVQILSTGKQTVMPPSVHPESKQPYIYLDDHELHNFRPESVPTLPDDYEEVIRQLMADVGLVADDNVIKVEFAKGYNSGSPHSDLNALAMKNLPKWIMQSGVARIKRVQGHANWAGVPQWRPSM